MENRKKTTTLIAIAGILATMLILFLGTLWMGEQAQTDSEKAIRVVSNLYLDELAGRREQVVADNLKGRIRDLHTAIEMLTDNDLSDAEHLQDYQSKMKKLFTLDRFAFVDDEGLVYTSYGVRDDIGQYQFDYKTLKGPEISIKNLEIADKKVVIAVPVSGIRFRGKPFVACFMEIDMKDMLAGVSMHAQESDMTFSNLYTKDGVALSNTILGGLAVEDNLLDALSKAEYENGGSFEKVRDDFANLRSGDVSFNYGGIRETLSYVPVEGTDWLLTYLIRESVISDEISFLSGGIIRRSVLQSLLMLVILLVVFAFIIAQNRKNTRLQLAKETADAEIRGKQQELDERIALQKKLEEQSLALSDALAAAEQANRAKTAFLSNMSHEIRTPMNAIIGLDNIALNDPTISEKTRGYLTRIGASADHLLNLINDILDMSRIESGRMTIRHEEFSFRKLLEAINTMFSGQCQEKGLGYRCNISGEIDDYYIGDDMKLRQVLINILGNAVKFTLEGGSVSLDVRRTAHYEKKSTLRFVISDTGIGMSREYLPHIFETFSQEDSSTTSRYGSSGLGMAITKNIVEMMNGNIKVESEKGKGSVFTVTVTLLDSDRKGSDEGEEEIHPGDMTVLVIDDDSVACEHAKLVLGKAGVSVDTALSGAEGIEMVKLRHARRDPYNLILVDWKMPEMDGIETTRRIREIVGSSSAIIILTAYRWDDVLKEATEAGVDSFLAKPLFASSVIDEFRLAAGKKRAKQSNEAREERLAGKRILLAEDVRVNAEIMIMILEARQVKVELAENGRIAVDMFTGHEAGYYDAILMDMRMPEMDGLEATKAIRQLDRGDAAGIPIIALTANAFDEDVQRSLQAGLNAHLSKPVQPEVLYETLESFV